MTEPDKCPTCPDCPVVERLKARVAELEAEREAFRLVTEWTKGNKYRAITGPHWNYCDFEMFVRDPHGSIVELQVNEVSAMACYVTAAKHLGLLPDPDEETT